MAQTWWVTSHDGFISCQHCLSYHSYLPWLFVWPWPCRAPLHLTFWQVDQFNLPLAQEHTWYCWTFSSSLPCDMTHTSSVENPCWCALLAGKWDDWTTACMATHGTSAFDGSSVSLFSCPASRYQLAACPRVGEGCSSCRSDISWSTDNCRLLACHRSTGTTEWSTCLRLPQIVEQSAERVWGCDK